MPVYKLAEEMPYEEFLGWVAYFEKRPVGWRDDDRTFKLLQVQGVKEPPQKIFSSLAAIYNSNKPTDGSFDVIGFKGSNLFSKLLSAKGGDKLEL
jgi:hypothetical protein